MPCGICHNDGHHRNTCPHQGIRGKIIYQIVCLILANHETVWGSRRITSIYGHGTITQYSAKLFKSMSAECFRELQSYIESNYKEQFDCALHFMHSTCTPPRTNSIAKQRNLDRKVCEFALSCIATIGPYRRIVFAGLSAYEVEHILNTPEIMQNPYLGLLRIWKCVGSTNIHPWISKMTFRRMSEAIEPSMRKNAFKMHIDDTLTIPHDCPDCPICMEPFTVDTVARLDCGHFVCAPCMYHSNELGHRKNVNCCLCRAPVTTLVCAFTS